MSQSEATDETNDSVWTIGRTAGPADFDSELFEFAIEGWPRAAKDLRASPDVA